MQFTIFLFVLSIIINIIITIVLISRNNVSQKLLKEIKTGVQNMVNDIENKISLAMDTSSELESLTKEASLLVKNISNKSSGEFTKTSTKNNKKSKLDTSTVPHEDDIIEFGDTLSTKKGEVQNKKNMIVLMLSQNHSIQSIVETLGVSVEEVNIIQAKEVWNMKKGQKTTKVP